MASMIQTMVIIIIVQLFFSFGINVYMYTLPDSMKVHVTPFASSQANIDIDATTQQVQDSIEQQTNFPLIDLGALAFYSGNIVIDLILNFAFAIPTMVGLLFDGVMQIFSIDTQLTLYIQATLAAGVTIWYFIGILQIASNIRTGRLIEG